MSAPESTQADTTETNEKSKGATLHFCKHQKREPHSQQSIQKRAKRQRCRFANRYQFTTLSVVKESLIGGHN